jgi:hypothetical protein
MTTMTATCRRHHGQTSHIPGLLTTNPNHLRRSLQRRRISERGFSLISFRTVRDPEGAITQSRDVGGDHNIGSWVALAA